MVCVFREGLIPDQVQAVVVADAGHAEKEPRSPSFRDLPPETEMLGVAWCDV